MAQERPGGGAALIFLTIIAAPAALGLESLLRQLLFPPEFEEIRAHLRPILTPIVWGLVLLTAILGVLAIVVQRRLAARALSRIPIGHRDRSRVRQAQLGAFLLAASVAQVPAILATLGFMWGSSLSPTLVAIAIASLSVAFQAFAVRRAERR